MDGFDSGLIAVQTGMTETHCYARKLGFTYFQVCSIPKSSR